jgi:hypothetical protein
LNIKKSVFFSRKWFIENYSLVSLYIYLASSISVYFSLWNLVDWLIDWLVFNVQRAIFQLYSGREHLDNLRYIYKLTKL